MFAPFSQARKWMSRAAMVDLPLAPERQEAVACALVLARQKRRATEALYDADCPAEALRVAVEALRAARAAVEAAVDAAPCPSATQRLEATLQAWGVAPRLAQRFPELSAELSSAELPATDERVGPGDLSRLDRVLRACWAVESAFAGVLCTRRRRAQRRIARVVVPLALGALIALGGWAMLLELQPRVTAYGTWSQHVSELGPHLVIDRDPKTEWVPPDASVGWLELRYLRRRDVRTITLRNGNNRGIQDRATRSYRIELYRGERLLAQASGGFVAIEPSPMPVVIELPARRVDRVRVVIDSYHGFGAALAEVEVQ